MSHQYYHLCRSNIGRPVRIRTHDGRWHYGRISNVSQQGVYVTPFGRQISSEEVNKQHTQAQTLVTTNETEHATEVQWWGYPGYYGYGAYWLPWAAIATLFLLPFFFI